MVRPVRLRLILNLLLSRFFPASNQTAELLSTAAVFAIGFLMRPLGSLIMGQFADKKGRKAALTPSVTINHGRWLLDHRLCPNLRPSRDHQPPHPGHHPDGARPLPGRGIWHQRHLHVRNGQPGPVGLLLIFPIRDPDRWPALFLAGPNHPRWPSSSA